MPDEHLGKRLAPEEDADHSRFEPDDPHSVIAVAVAEAQPLSRQSSLAETVLPQDRDDGFLALL